MFSRIASRVTKTTGRRYMGGGHHKKVEYTGIDAVVRKVLPEDHQVAMGVIAMYGTLILIASSGKKKKPVEVVVAAPSAGGIPDIDSPEFEAWANVEGNVEKYFSSLA